MTTLPSRRRRRALAVGVTATVAAGVTAVVTQAPAEAAACTAPVKYASSSNTIYLLSGSWTPALIKQNCAAAPIDQVDPVNHVWELRGDLVVTGGATLALHSSKAGTPGDVDVLRLRSLASALPTDVSVLTTKWGTLDVDGTHITSWDDAANKPDSTTALPSGAPTGSRARAYIRAQSYLDGGTPRLSTMTFKNALVENLGWYSAEAYGVSWKSLGCSHAAADLPTCASVPVTGGATNSTFTGNYMGAYVWGGHAMTFTGNAFTRNVMYGLDTHDVTTQLDVERNRFTYNGDHGFICSQHCDRLTVTDNESGWNGQVPWAGPNPSGETTGGQVHGIMLHRTVTNTVVARNKVHDQPNGAGIALFETSGQSIHDNVVTNNLYGLRLSVAASKNVFTNNTVTGSTKYGVYTYKGNDAPDPANGASNGHPADNVFTTNTITGSGAAAVNLNETDGTRFTGTSFGGGAISVHSSAGTRIDGGLVAGQAVGATGTSGEPTDVKLVNVTVPTTSTLADAYSKQNVTSTAGRIFTVAGAAYSQSVTPSGSTVTLTTAKTGTTSPVTVTPSNVAVLPGSGSVKASSAGGTTAKITLTAATAGTGVTVTVSQLTPSKAYTVAGGSGPSTVVTATAAGVLTFTRTLATTSATSFTVTPK